MKGIPMQAWEVQAILDERKTQFRRPIKPQPPHATFSRIKGGHGCNTEVADNYYMNPPYQVGDIVYVKETWCNEWEDPKGWTGRYLYKADGKEVVHVDGVEKSPWRSSIHMPQEAARIFLKITKVRVERLQDISEDDCDSEIFGGDFAHHPSVCRKHPSLYNDKGVCIEPEHCECDNYTIPELFSMHWDDIYAKRGYGWDTNPWVWVYEFERTEAPNETNENK